MKSYLISERTRTLALVRLADKVELSRHTRERVRQSLRIRVGDPLDTLDRITRRTTTKVYQTPDLKRVKTPPYAPAVQPRNHTILAWGSVNFYVIVSGTDCIYVCALVCAPADTK